MDGSLLSELFQLARQDAVQLAAGATLAGGTIVFLAKHWGSSGMEHGWAIGLLFLSLGVGWLLFAANGPFAWGALAGLGTSSTWAYRRTGRLRHAFDEQVREFGSRCGLSFEGRTTEPIALIDELTGMDGIALFRVLRGSWHEMPVTVGEYRFADNSGNDLPSYGVARCAITSIDRRVPEVRITHHTVITRARKRMKADRQSLGDPEFDHRFRVESPSTQSATPTLGARTRAWLLENDRYARYLIRDESVVVCAPYRPNADDIGELLAWLRSFRAVLLRDAETNA